MNNQGNVILRFDKVSFAYNDGKKIILDEADFSLREQTKITIMGQNGAGKSTMFKMIMGELQPQKGRVILDSGKTIAIAKQVIPRDQMHLTLREYFVTAFTEKDYQLDRKIANVLEEVQLTVLDYDKQLKDFSGGQQARLLLAHALIQDPDILLLDEPTNNLDDKGIWNLIGFLLTYPKTVVVISHDADFLNMFTDGVLYLNVQSHKVEQYRWDYYDVVEQIAAQIEKEKMLNARMEKQINDAKAKVSFFENKWGKMRKLASKLRDEIEDSEENKVDVRKDDKTISRFHIEFENLVGPLITINNVELLDKNHERVMKKVDLIIKKGMRYQLVWPNGIGKTTLLKRLFNSYDNDAMIADEVRVWYYSQDFNALDMNMLVWDALHEVSNEVTDQEVYKVASQFLLTGDLLKNTIASLSEWQKGLLCYARFVIQKPHVLILDEPTNHINFRHLPVIAQALNAYEWGIIMVSHDQAWVDQLKDIEILDLGRLV